MKALYEDLRTFARKLGRRGNLFKVAAALIPRFEIAAALRCLKLKCLVSESLSCARKLGQAGSVT